MLVETMERNETTDQLVSLSLFFRSFKVGLCTVTQLGVASGRGPRAGAATWCENAKQNFSVFLPVWPKVETHGGKARQSMCSK